MYIIQDNLHKLFLYSFYIFSSTVQGIRRYTMLYIIHIHEQICSEIRSLHNSISFFLTSLSNLHVYSYFLSFYFSFTFPFSKIKRLSILSLLFYYKIQNIFFFCLVELFIFFLNLTFPSLQNSSPLSATPPILA